MTARSLFSKTVMVGAGLLLATRAPAADRQIRPFIGATFAGGTTFVDPEDAIGKPHWAIGASAVFLGEILGAEIDVFDSPGFFQAGDKNLVRVSHVATFSGNVHVTQGDTEMHSKVLVVYYVDPNKPAPVPASTMKTAPGGAAPGTGEQQIRRIEATGGVLVTQKGQNAAGESGIFDMQSNTVTLNGNVVVTRGKDVVRGQRLVVDLNTGVSRIDGGRVDALFGSPPPPNGETNLPGAAPRPSRAN